MQHLPSSLEDAIEALGVLPGVGQKSAERFAYYLLQADDVPVQKLASAIEKLKEGIDYCEVTYALIEKGQKVSPLYIDDSRDKTTIAVVADSFDIIALEKTGAYKGTYHVLGGLLSPIDGLGPEELHIPELLNRIKKDKVKEIILATNASVEGESTALYIQKHIDGDSVEVTRLARGLPVGTDIDYTDQITLSRALEGRTPL
jgi:recombination protein RecR